MIDPSARVSEIQRRLEAALQPVRLEVRDESHLHVGHAGARDGRGHFAVLVVSAQFAGERALARHRRVYEAMDELMNTDIHALSIDARTPEEC